ncbi:MAG: hypothetical protein CFH10_01484 [Alphaproteobacteria bacterium MarineAlpha4_Bin2]|nr:MAG: hypothetical protein CFH10_01484 [Alphaproteobacteria bacterium MarineAlpha4_Bin2]
MESELKLVQSSFKFNEIMIRCRNFTISTGFPVRLEAPTCDPDYV